MSRILDVAAVHFNVSERGDQGREEAFRQFREAEERLDGTGVDLLVTCEGMSSLSQSVAEAESIRQAVSDKFGIELLPEVKYVF